MKTKLKLHLLLLALLILAGSAHAQGTAIGYQGRLNDGGLPATGLYDFTFAVFDAEAGGVALAVPVVRDAVPVTNGLFNVSLDFGPGIFTGPARWLEITVRTSGVGEPTLLTPRSSLLPAPYSVFAGKAAGVVDGTVTAAQLNAGGVPPTPGQFLSYDGANLAWSDPGVAAGNIWSLNGSSAYYSAGSVGLGTVTPTAGYRLEVNGATLLRPPNGTVQFGSPSGETGMSITPTAGNRADLRFDGTTLKLLASTGVGPPPSVNGIAVTTAGNVGIGTTTPGFKLDVRSDTSTAIVGRSTFGSGVGVYGESSDFNGVRGVANNVNHGAVVGVHNSGGVGVLGQSTGVGVSGKSLSNGAGVYGESAQFGVYGNATGVGTGVYGRSVAGSAVHAEGNATQARDKGGFVKAMAYIDPFLPADQYVVRCYNSQQAGNASASCGITVTRLESIPGTYFIDFGFNVQDRFFSLTAQADINFQDIMVGQINSAGGSEVSVTFQRAKTDDAVDTRFHIIVY